MKNVEIYQIFCYIELTNQIKHMTELFESKSKIHYEHFVTTFQIRKLFENHIAFLESMLISKNNIRIGRDFGNSDFVYDESMYSSGSVYCCFSCRRRKSGKYDGLMGRYLSNRERFADLMNGIMFDGKQMIDPKSLEREAGDYFETEGSLEADQSKIERKSQGKYRIVQRRYRDLKMRSRQNGQFRIFALENRGVLWIMFASYDAWNMIFWTIRSS